MLHEPEPGAARGICVLLLSPGIKGRVGPHRLYIKLATALTRLGFHVLRFDFSGLGDSEGSLEQLQLADVYNSILCGRYVDETITAMNFLQGEFGLCRFVGSGLCGGSITALLTAEQDGRIECLLGIALPTALEGGRENWGRILTQYEVSVLRSQYFRKLASPRSWLRLISGKSSYHAIWAGIRQWFEKQGAGTKPPSPGAAPAMASTNPRFATAFMSMLKSSRPMMLIFSQADRLRYEFGENFETPNAELIAPLRDGYEVHVIPHANHVMSDPQWVEELVAVSTRWLVARFGPHGATAVQRPAHFS
jgi:pimeloyl-ACP methyl ester carboxylesterase